MTSHSRSYDEELQRSIFVQIASAIGDLESLIGISFLISVVFVMRYAKKVKANPQASLVTDMKADNEKHFLEKKDAQGSSDEFTFKHKLILSIFVATFGVMIWGVSAGGWWMTEMSILFLVSSIIIAITGGLNEKNSLTALSKAVKTCSVLCLFSVLPVVLAS